MTYSRHCTDHNHDFSGYDSADAHYGGNDGDDDDGDDEDDKGDDDGVVFAHNRSLLVDDLKIGPLTVFVQCLHFLLVLFLLFLVLDLFFLLIFAFGAELDDVGLD